MLRLFRRVLLAVLLFFVGGSLAIIVDGLQDNLHTADIAVVLGNKVRPDGVPSQMLKARLNHTAELYRQGYFKLILVSGGLGKEGYNEPVVMRHYLESQGVPHDVIFEDNGGTNTWGTAKDTASFLAQHHLTSALIISQYFHIPRCRLAFARFGIAPVYSSHAPYWSVRDFYSVPREVVGYVGYYFRASGIQ
jgi:vancomycin permeability regulator SanA